MWFCSMKNFSYKNVSRFYAKIRKLKKNLKETYQTLEFYNRYFFEEFSKLAVLQNKY